MIQYKLTLSDSYSWSHYKGVYVKGNAFYGNILLSAKQIAEKLSTCINKTQINNVVNELNGFYAIIIIRDLFILSVTDRILSYPLFYSINNEMIYIGDDVQLLVSETKAIFNSPLIWEEFSLTGFVTNSDTLFENVYQLQSGEIVWFDIENKMIKRYSKRYYQFKHQYNNSLSEEDWLQRYDNVVTHSFERCLEVVGKRQIVVPLSSGYDSRLVVLAFKKLGLNNITTFSYGKKGHKSIEISKRIAEKLSYKWHYVEYSNEKWSEWSKTKEWIDYQYYSGGYRVIPHFQDWPAIRELKEKGILAPDCFIVGGHAADPIAGSRITITPETLQKKQPSEKEFIICILKSHYNMKPWPHSTSNMIKRYGDRILNSIGSLSNYTSWASAFDAYNENERQAKFIVNIERATEYWGYSWWMPLFDKEYFTFWEEVPICLRVGERLHIDYINNLYEKICNDHLPIPNETKYDRYTKPKRNNIKDKTTNLFINIWRSKYLKILRNKKLMKYAVRNYYNDPMAWNGILNLHDYIKYVIDGKSYFHSIIADKYMDLISNRKH